MARVQRILENSAGQMLLRGLMQQEGRSVTNGGGAVPA